MTTKKKRIISILLTIVMILSMIPVLTITVLAEGGGEEPEGPCEECGHFPCECSKTITGSSGLSQKSPRIIEATPNSATWNGSGNITFRVEKPLHNFRLLRHNWNFVNEYNYEAGYKGTTITLSEDFLKTLEKGYNIITIHFTDHKYAEFHLWIK